MCCFSRKSTSFLPSSIQYSYFGNSSLPAVAALQSLQDSELGGSGKGRGGKHFVYCNASRFCLCPIATIARESDLTLQQKKMPVKLFPLGWTGFQFSASSSFFPDTGDILHGIRPILLAQARARCLGWLKGRNDEKGGISPKGTLAKKGGNSRPHLLLLLRT